MVHKAHVKDAIHCTNRKDWEYQIMTVHARENASLQLTDSLIGKMD